MSFRIDPATRDYELIWPRTLFRKVLSSLVDSSRPKDWSTRVELLLEEAFAGSTPRDDFAAIGTAGSDPWSDPWAPTASTPDQFLRNLLDQVEALPEASERRPYWSERKGGATRDSLTFEAVVRAVLGVVGELGEGGYFEEKFGMDCVDAPSEVSSDAVVEQACGRSGLWAATPSELAGDKDAFFDLIEVLHDLVSRPRHRWLHSYAGCGWHHSDFSRAHGQELYRWRVNKLLDRSDVGLRLADDGEDQGRLVEVTDDGRTALVQSMIERADPATGDRVRHAIALFRARSADEHDKRSAAMALALVLEERRSLLKEELLSKDEGALFRIANEFAVRHQNGTQRQDYDEAFRDWIFWWYLATIELSDRLLARGAVVAGRSIESAELGK